MIKFNLTRISSHFNIIILSNTTPTLLAHFNLVISVFVACRLSLARPCKCGSADLPAVLQLHVSPADVSVAAGGTVAESMAGLVTIRGRSSIARSLIPVADTTIPE